MTRQQIEQERRAIERNLKVFLTVQAVVCIGLVFLILGLLK